MISSKIKALHAPRTRVDRFYLSQRTSLRKTDQDQEEDGVLPNEATSHLQTKMKVTEM